MGSSSLTPAGFAYPARDVNVEPHPDPARARLRGLPACPDEALLVCFRRAFGVRRRSVTR